ncbi:LysR family transcriptional regulator [Paraburkholderia sp. HD33-4]|uniref:LysR family transcriptional regulator n=1 Tax=Paraburkholderia sp. HD33-4 TaxID=2883242 RepID=UPI001F291D4D|nr:LysR family transcriptional regulator [Paraburkholderia sp. HD33-4]
MDTIPQRSEGDVELDLHHLQVFDVLLTEHSLTKAARVLNLSQPALSKTLARLRLYFGDPLFVRVGLRMEPTPKALELTEPVRAILKGVRGLRSDHGSFDPKTSTRKFSFFLVDAGAIKIFPRLLNYLAAEAPGICVQSIPCDAQHLDVWLESGLVDIAIGSFPSLTMGIRRLPLWNETYVSVTRKDHPRIGTNPTKAQFVAEKHALVSALGTGHEHLAIERLIESEIPRSNIVCRVPVFTSAALIAKHSDVIATVPRSLAVAMCGDLDLQLVEPPIELPKLEIAQYWHDRCHLEPGNQWLRSTFRKLFSTPG